MKYGIFGDVHSNREAFQKVIEEYKKEDIAKFICVGDIVGYGVDPHWCIEEVQSLDAEISCGNHDWASVGRFSTEYFNYAAREAVKWTQENLKEEEKEFLKSLDLVIDRGDFTVVHGSLDSPDFFYYIIDERSAYRCFRNMENRNMCFVGHSHVPVVFSMKDGEIKYTYRDFVELEDGVKYIVNVGSVGQPRDGNPSAAFSIYDSDRRTVEIKRVSYDIESAKNKILNAGLPEVLGYRLLEGR